MLICPAAQLPLGGIVRPLGLYVFAGSKYVRVVLGEFRFDLNDLWIVLALCFYVELDGVMECRRLDLVRLWCEMGGAFYFVVVWSGVIVVEFNYVRYNS